MQTKYDYPAMRAEFIAADPPITINELCASHGIPTPLRSSIQKRAQREDWRGLRDQRLVRTDNAVVDLIATRAARRQLRRMEVEENAIEAIDEAISKMRVDMTRTRKVKDPETQEWKLEPVSLYRPEQVSQLIDRIKGLFDGTVVPSAAPGGPEQLTQINFNSFDGDDPNHRALAAQVVAATRGAGGSARGASSASPLPSAPDSRQDQ